MPRIQVWFSFHLKEKSRLLNSDFIELIVHSIICNHNDLTEYFRIHDTIFKILGLKRRKLDQYCGIFK